MMNAHRSADAQAPLGVRLCWIGFTTFIIRAYQDIVSNFILTIVPPAMTTALYFIVFGTLIGGRIGSIDGLHYEHYIAPGLIGLPIITSSYGQGGLAFVVAKMYRQLDEHLISPQPSWMIVVSYVAGGTLRGIIAGLAQLAQNRGGVLDKSIP